MNSTLKNTEVIFDEEERPQKNKKKTIVIATAVAGTVLAGVGALLYGLRKKKRNNEISYVDDGEDDFVKKNLDELGECE